MPGIGAERDHGLERVRIDLDTFIELGALVGRQLAPEAERAIPRRAAWREAAASDVLIRDIVRSHQPCACTRLNRHIANRHSLFHRKRANCRAGIFKHTSRTAADSNSRDQVQDDVLCRDAWLQRPADSHFVRLGAPLQQALSRQNLFHFAGPNAECKRAESAVCRCVAISADDRHTRLRQSLLGTDDMHDALILAVWSEYGNAKIGAVLFELRDLGFSHFVQNGKRAVMSRNTMIRGPNRQIGSPHFQSALTKTGKRLR